MNILSKITMTSEGTISSKISFWESIDGKDTEEIAIVKLLLGTEGKFYLQNMKHFDAWVSQDEEGKFVMNILFHTKTENTFKEAEILLDKCITAFKRDIDFVQKIKRTMQLLKELEDKEL